MSDLESPKRSPGRPCGRPGFVRGNRVVTYITDVELTELQRIVDREGRSRSAIVHQILAKALLKPAAGMIWPSLPAQASSPGYSKGEGPKRPRGIDNRVTEA